MKKSIFIIALLALVFCSCDNREDRGMLTQRGKQVSEKWENVTDVILRNVVNESFHLNAWINADDSLRRIIENQYYTNKRVRLDGENVYGIYNEYGTLLMTVYTHGATLADANAAWEIHRTSMGDYGATDCLFEQEPEVVFNLEALGNNSWHLSMDSATAAGSSLDLTLGLSGVAVPYDVLVQSFTLEGSGSYDLDGTIYYYDGVTPTHHPVTLQFNIEKSLQQLPNPDQCMWVLGKMNLKAKFQGYDDIDVVAEYLGTDGMNITYRGVTERWETWRIEI